MPGERDAAAAAIRMHRLLVLSLNAWGLIGRAELINGTAIQITGLGHSVIVTAQESGAPFRWMVAINGRNRPALSVSAVLRQIRTALDATYRPGRARSTAGIDTSLA